MGKKLQTTENLTSLLQIVTNRLKEGEVYKNFKELCRKLDQPDNTTSNSRKSQEAFFERCFDYHKIEGTQKIMIDKIYDSVLPEMNTTGMTLLFQELFLSWVEATDRYDECFYIDDITLLSELCFINCKYFEIRKHIYIDMYWKDDKEQSDYSDFIRRYDYILKHDFCNRFVRSLIKRCIIGYGRECYTCNGVELDSNEETLWKTDTLLYVAKNSFDTDSIFYCISNPFIKDDFWEKVEEKWQMNQSKFSNLPKKTWKLQLSRNIADLILFDKNKDKTEIELNHQLVHALKKYAKYLSDFSKINTNILLFSENTTKEEFNKVADEILIHEQEAVDKNHLMDNFANFS